MKVTRAELLTAVNAAVAKTCRCGRRIQARGMCAGHWQRWFRSGDPQYDTPFRAATVQGQTCQCGRPVYAKGKCTRCYQKRIRERTG